MDDLPVKSEFPDKPASLKKAIKEALRPYNRQFLSTLVADAVDKAIDISLQQNNDLPKSFQFLKWAENHRPRIPQAILNLPVPENEDSFRPDNYLQISFESRFREYKYLQRQHSENLQGHIADQQISPLQVLFGFMDIDFDSVDL